jgi:hypothetical protein
VIAALVLALAASAAAAVGWTRTVRPVQYSAPSVRIVDVRPLQTADANLRNLITHTFAVRVAISGWKLLPYNPGGAASESPRRAGHWRLYLDGNSLGDNYGSSTVTYTTYLTPGVHWLAAELSGADSSSLRPAVWSEPVVLHVPRVVHCWQAGGVRADGAPTFTCNRPRS